jgi:peptidoglycan hydrolase-like protein with peptidoglycan-binding domain
MKTGIKKGIVALGLFAGGLAFANAAYFDTAPITRCDVRLTNYLSFGSKDSQVLTLQDILARGGYLQATPNGYFGPSTRAAVRAFQGDNGLPTSGVVGSATLNALNERACDSDTRGDSLSYASNYYDTYNNYLSYSSPVTYVDPYDAYVKVISPAYSNPVAIPVNQSTIPTIAFTSSGIPDTSSVSTYITSSNSIAPVYTPATSQVANTNIIYSPSIGYTYGIVPQPGVLTILSPLANTLYNEGDTVNLAWSTNNLNATGFTILLENTSTGQSKVVAYTSNKNTSFLLTKAVLDGVCAGACDNNQQGSFRIVITTPVTDIAGVTSTFRAAIAPITVKRPYSNFGTVSISTNKTPVASGEIFKLYVNIPTGASWNSNLYGNYSFKIRATCPPSVTVSIAGVQCGQDFVIPLAPTYFQQEIPTAITNASWYTQTVTYQITVTNLLGQTLGTAMTNVVVNAAPFTW